MMGKLVASSCMHLGPDQVCRGWWAVVLLLVLLLLLLLLFAYCVTTQVAMQHAM
jgi:uncharacterized integral membrane protein